MDDAIVDETGPSSGAKHGFHLSAICIGRAETVAGKSYKTGINKMAVRDPVMIGRSGIVGDAVCNGRYHGGPEQAVLLEGEKTLDWWRDKLGRAIPEGMFGENLVISGLDNRDVSAGDIFRVGSALILQATSPRTPCRTLAVRLGDAKFVQAYRKALRPGIYCRVLEPGVVSSGDSVEHIAFAAERIPIPEMLEKFGKRLSEDEARRYLGAPIHARMRKSILATGRARF